MHNPKSELQTYFHYCPRCGAKLSAVFLRGNRELHCGACGFIFFMNAKPCTAILLIKNATILLVRRAIEPHRGDWDLPGGFLEVGETPEQGARRELKEELNITPGNMELLGVYTDWYASNPPQATIGIDFIVRRWKGTLTPTDDVDAFRWFSLAKLPKNIAFRSIRVALHDAKKSITG